MSETLRELIVRLSLDSGSFSSQIKATNTAVKQAEANFKLAGAGVTGFDKTLAGAQAKAVMLTAKLQAQNIAVALNKAKLDASKTALEKNQKQQQTLAQKIDVAKKAYEAESAATGKTSSASQALAADLQKLEGQQKAVEKQAVGQAAAINQGELALTQATLATKETEAALRTANKEVAKASTVWAKFGSATAGAQKALANAGKSLSSAGRKLTMGLTVPIVAAGVAAYKAFETMDDGLDTMIRKTGATGPALALLEKSYNAVFGGVKTTAGDAGIAVGEVSTRFKVAGMDLENLSTLFIQFANVTETDLNGSIGKTQKILSQWGLGVESAGGLLGLLTSESQRTGLSVDKLFDSIQVNGATLKGMGMNLSQSVQMMANFEAAGINAEVAMMALKKSAVTYTKEGKTLETGFASTVKAIQDASTETKALAIAQKVFGAKGALEMAVAIREGRLSVTGLTADMTKMGGVVSRTFADIENDTPVLDKVKNKLIATGAQFGKSLLPYLEQAAAKMGSLVDGFAKMDPAMQQNMLGLAAVAAGVGPVLSGLGKVATGASVLLKAFSGPVGWITLAVAGLVTLGVILHNIETPAQKLDKMLKSFTLEVDTTSSAGITTAIDAGIAAANKLHTIQVGVDIDTNEMITQLDLAFADGKFTQKEFHAATKFVRDIVGKDIKLAKIGLKNRVDVFRATLDGALDDMGNPVFSEERKTELTAAVTAETNSLIAQLQGYTTDYNALLAQIYKDKDTPTQAEIDNLNALLEKIGAIRVQLQAEQQQAILVAQAYAELALAGEGGPEATAMGVAFTQETGKYAEADRKAQLDKELAANQEAINAVRATGENNAETNVEIAALQADSAAAVADYTADVAASGAKSQETIQAMIDAAAAKYPAAAAEVERWVALAERLAYLNTMENDPTNTSGMAQGWVAQEQAKLATEATTKPLDTDVISPITTMLNGLLASGSLEGLDVTKLDGTLLNMLKLANFMQVGSSVGKDLMGGVIFGTEAAGKALTAADFAQLPIDFVTALNGAFGIKSPASTTKPTGRAITAGIAVGVLEAVDEFTGAIQALYAAGIAEANKQEIILRNHLAWLSSTRGGNTPDSGGPSTNNQTYNASANFTAGTVVINNSGDAKTLARIIADENHRQLTGMGKRG